MIQRLSKLMNYLFATSKHSDLDFERFQQLESKKTIRKDQRHV